MNNQKYKKIKIKKNIKIKEKKIKKIKNIKSTDQRRLNVNITRALLGLRAEDPLPN
jgi:hypothetical protein